MALISNLTRQLQTHEGLRLAAYLDTEGILTVGYGHNCPAAPVPGVLRPGDSITRQQADELLRGDIDIAVCETRAALPWIDDCEINDPRRAVLFNMAFNLGVPRLLGFKRMLAAVRARDWKAAAAEMLTSKWARQVKTRAAVLADQMETGAWRG